MIIMGSNKCINLHVRQVTNNFYQPNFFDLRYWEVLYHKSQEVYFNGIVLAIDQTKFSLLPIKITHNPRNFFLFTYSQVLLGSFSPLFCFTFQSLLITNHKRKKKSEFSKLSLRSVSRQIWLVIRKFSPRQPAEWQQTNYWKELQLLIFSREGQVFVIFTSGSVLKLIYCSYLYALSLCNVGQQWTLLLNRAESNTC